MKTLGLIGGMSWESSIIYYELINKEIRKTLGGLHSCKNVMLTVDMDEVAKLQHAEEWDPLNELMADSAKKLEGAGADLILLCTNTMHLCSDAIEESVSIPFLHIADATGKAIQKAGLKKVALLGTNFTMEKAFYKNVLKDRHQIEVIVPDLEDRMEVHRTIYDELILGEINPDSRERLKVIIEKLAKLGAEGLVLGCTELPLLISEGDVSIPVFSTTEIHAAEAVRWALDN